MPWTTEQQVALEAQLAAIRLSVDKAANTWIQSVEDAAREPGLATAVGVAKSALDNTIQQYRDFVNKARDSSDNLNGSALDEVSKLAAQVAEEKEQLKLLRAEKGTREEQADSINPKVVPSPYVNILGLQRTFRDSTRIGILIAAIVFGVLALGALGFLVYQLMTTGIEPTISLQTGGKRHVRFAV